LIQGRDGNIYGTTLEGGPLGGWGTIYKLSLDGEFTIVHAFSGVDGAAPYIGVLEGRGGNFYGTTRYGGTFNGGTIFEMTPDGTVTVLHSFTEPEGVPFSPLIQGTDERLYGARQDPLSVYTITTDGVFTVLPAFIAGGGAVTSVIQGRNGQFYGTTTGGAFGFGTVFRMTADGSIATVIHQFTGTSDGGIPESGLLQTSDGNLYGTTTVGGEFNEGGIFTITTSGVLTSLQSFKGDTGLEASASGLIHANDGNLYGTTIRGGSGGDGAVFRLGNVAPCDNTLTLADSAGTLNLKFTLKTSSPAVWGTWIFDGQNVAKLWLYAIPTIEPAVSFTVPLTGIPSGPVGGYTLLINQSLATCWQWKTVDR